MDPNCAVLFLNRSKNEMVLGSMFATATPFDSVISETAAEITLVQLLKNLAEIEVLAFLAKIQLLLHRQPAMSNFALCFLRHNSEAPRGGN